MTHMTQRQKFKIVAGAAFCACLEKWRKLRKIHTFGALQRKTRIKSSIFMIFSLKVSKLEEVAQKC